MIARRVAMAAAAWFNAPADVEAYRRLAAAVGEVERLQRTADGGASPLLQHRSRGRTDCFPEVDVGSDLRKQAERARPQGPGLVLNRLGEEGIAALVQEYVDGASVREVSPAFGISRPSAFKVLHEHGVIRRRKLFSVEDAAEAVQLYASGLSVEATGQRLGYSARPCGQHCTRPGCGCGIVTGGSGDASVASAGYESRDSGVAALRGGSARQCGSQSGHP